MRKLGKIAIVGAAVGAAVYLAQKCMPKMSVFFAHEDLNVEDYGLTDEDFDMLFESDDFEQPDGKFEEPYFTV